MEQQQLIKQAASSSSRRTPVPLLGLCVYVSFTCACCDVLFTVGNGTGFLPGARAFVSWSPIIASSKSTLTDSLGLLICGRSLIYSARIKLIDFSLKLFYSCKGESEGVFANFSKLEHSIIWNMLSREWPMTKSCILTIITNELLPVCKNS